MISVVIPSRNDKYLADTLASLYKNYRRDVEVIVVLDGPTEYPLPEDRPGLYLIQEPEPKGIRPAINRAVSMCSGDYILKLDSHCIVADNFIPALVSRCEDNWVVVAGRYTLDLASMSPKPRRVDYYYLSCPWTHPKSFMMQSCPWIDRTEQRADVEMDDLMCFQGSMWMMSRKHWDWLGGLETDLTYAEHHEISMKTWLGGGRVVINKETWYAHPAKASSGYHMSLNQVYKDHAISARYWTENKWPGRLHDFDWLIDRFWPLPTEGNRHRTEKYYWPENWKNNYAN